MLCHRTNKSPFFHFIFFSPQSGNSFRQYHYQSISTNNFTFVLFLILICLAISNKRRTHKFIPTGALREHTILQQNPFPKSLRRRDGKKILKCHTKHPLHFSEGEGKLLGSGKTKLQEKQQLNGRNIAQSKVSL